MREASLETDIIRTYGAYFTDSSARQAATEGLSRQDIYLLATYMNTHKELLTGNKKNYFTNTKTYLNERYGDYHAYLLFEKLRDPPIRAFDDENDYLSQFSALIKETQAPAPLKNLLLNRVYPPHHFDQEKQKYTNFIEKYKRFDCYIIANKCAELGKVLDPARLNYLTQHLQDMSHVSENFYDFIAREIVTNGVSHTIAHFNELKAQFDEQNQASAQSLAELDDADTAEINPPEVETDDSVEFIDVTEPTLVEPPPRKPPSWAREAAKDTIPLPYLHEKINPADLREGKLSRNIERTIDIGEESYSIYKKGYLGGGSFGKVYLTQNNNTGEWIAVKRISQSSQSDINAEIENLKAAKNFIFEGTTASGATLIGMKLHKGMELKVLLEKTKEPETPARLSEAQRFLIAKKMLKSTIAIHYDTNTMIATTNLKGIDKDKRIDKETRLLHRDIKPENMMIDSALNTEQIDLGLAGKVTREQSKIQEGAMGSPFFMSPEISKERGNVTYSESSEVYALGVSMLEIFDLGDTNYPIIDKKKARYHDPELVALIASMIDKEASNRPTVLQCYSQLDKIIGNSNANNPTTPAGLKVYAVNIQDFGRAQREGTLKEFVQNIANKGTNSIAFYSADPTVTASVLIEAQRAFAEVGIVHIAPNLFCNQQNEVNLENIQKYYNVLLGAQATRIHTQEMPGVEISQNVQHKDIEKMVKKFINDKGDIHFILKVEEAAKMPDRKEALGHLMDTVIRQLNSPNGGEFYSNGGKTLIDKMMKLPSIQHVIAERHPDARDTRANLLKAGVSPKLNSLMRTSLFNRIDNLVENATKETQTQKENPSPTRSSR